MKTRTQRAKEWCITNAYTLASVGAVSGIVALTVFAAKKAQEQNEAAYQALQDASARGATILPSPYGGYWIIEPQEAQ